MSANLAWFEAKHHQTVNFVLVFLQQEVKLEQQDKKSEARNHYADSDENRRQKEEEKMCFVGTFGA